MDLSALIFVALAVAWAVYLVPKALRQHEAGESSRSIESFSGRLRVLGGRSDPETTAAREAHVVRPGEPAASVEMSSGAALRPARRRGPSAAARRRRVLGAVLVLLLGLAVLAAVGVLAWGWIAVPLVVLVAWLVACRLMVRREQSSVAARPRPAVPGEPVAGSVDTPPAPPAVSRTLPSSPTAAARRAAEGPASSAATGFGRPRAG